MAYRETAKTRARQRANRARILGAGRRLVAEGGFQALTVAAVAERAGVATGTVYRYFDGKSSLAVEVFSEASGREVEVITEALAGPPPVVERLAAAITLWCRRAQAGRTLALALLAEPAEPAVAEARLRYRARYAATIAGAIQRAVRCGELPEQDVSVAAAGIVGAMAEAVLGPHGDPDPEIITAFCLSALHPWSPRCPPTRS